MFSVAKGRKTRREAVRSVALGQCRKQVPITWVGGMRAMSCIAGFGASLPAQDMGSDLLGISMHGRDSVDACAYSFRRAGDPRAEGSQPRVQASRTI